ncbi:hypothetical protein [Nocardia sp. NPDC004722]
MGRQADDGRHEGWIMHLFADGWGGGGGTLDTVTAFITPDGTFLQDANQWQDRPLGEVVAWQAVCQDSATGEIHWRGPRIDRAATPADVDAGRGYSENGYAEDGDALAENLYIGWDVHIAPGAILREITETSTAIGELEQRRLGKVQDARLLGQSWDAIGRAAGITRQAAWERWAKHTG